MQEGIVSVPKSSGTGSSSESKKAAVSVVGGLKPPAADQEGLKCPRCNSLNTKFCYYNNYSLTQPRHFCKSCRRYWTKGGALRNVPIGGGCRKNKKITNNNCKLMMISTTSTNNSSSSSSVSSDRTASMITNSDHDQYHQAAAAAGSCQYHIKPHHFSDTLRLFHGSVTTPAANIPHQSPLDSFHQYSLPAFSRLQPGGVMNHFLSFSNMSISPNSTSCSSINGVSSGAAINIINPSFNSNSAGNGYNDHVSNSTVMKNSSELASSTGFCGYAAGGGLILGHDHQDHNSMASSIESLSSMNADLHWKLQQQRLQAMFLGGGDQHQNHQKGIMNNLDGLIVQNHQSLQEGYYHQDHQKQQHEQLQSDHAVCNDQINVINVAEAKAGTGGRSSSFHEGEFGEVKEQQTSVNGDHQWVFESPWQELHQYSSTTALR